MADLYFMSEWIIEGPYATRIIPLTDIVLRLQSLVSFETKVDGEGYYVAKFVIRVPSEPVLVEFIAKVSEAIPEMKLTRWIPATEADFVRPIAPGLEELNVAMAWVNGIASLGYINRDRRKQSGVIPDEG